MLVTTLGSCRQDSIKNYYNVSKIGEELTYPHYTKEVIQAIEFCKGISTIQPQDTITCFRSGFLSKKELNSNDFNNDYCNTDIFIIEIASRIVYKYNNNYTHHIVSEDSYGFHDRNNINIYTQTDNEIEEDLLKIRDLLYPKPFIIVSHIYTESTSSRYELVILLKRLTDKYNIPFMNPSELLKDYNKSEIYQNERPLHHFTPIGHELIRVKYNEKICEVLSNINL